MLLSMRFTTLQTSMLKYNLGQSNNSSFLFKISLNSDCAEMVIVWGTAENRKVFSTREIHQKIGEKMSAALIGLHVFTGNGKISAISGLGKVNPYKKVIKSEQLRNAFTNLGNERNINFILFPLFSFSYN